jgi:molybdopterin-guanine dinucleotide biosynthesis protein A
MMSRPECDGLMCRTNREGQCQIEPFPAVFRLRAAATISARLSSGRRSVRSLCDEESFLPIDVPAEWPASVWINLNTPGDVAAFESAGRCGVADGTTK